MEGSARRWLVEISAWNPSAEEFSSLVSLLPPTEHSSVLKFIRLEDRKRALVSQLLQYDLAHEMFGIPFDQIIIHRTIHGKPYLVNTYGNTRFDYSVSHGGNYVGIASELDRPIGLDVVSRLDFKTEPSVDLLDGLSSYFTEFEWSKIVSAGGFDLIVREFCRYWSLKEAYVKALGTGLSQDINRLEFHHSNWSNISLHINGTQSKDWTFSLFDLDDQHWVSVAKGGVEGDWQGQDCSLGFKDPELGFMLRKVDELTPKF